MNNKREKLILEIMLIIIFILIIIYSIIFVRMLTTEKNVENKVKENNNYLNIDRNKAIENPTTEDLQNLINQVRNQ